jgi:hypothetical protein
MSLLLFMWDNPLWYLQHIPYVCDHLPATVRKGCATNVDNPVSFITEPHAKLPWWMHVHRPAKHMCWWLWFSSKVRNLNVPYVRAHLNSQQNKDLWLKVFLLYSLCNAICMHITKTLLYLSL